MFAFLSVVLNLIVVTAIKEKENSLDVFNVLLANLCLSNLTRYEVRFWLEVDRYYRSNSQMFMPG